MTVWVLMAGMPPTKGHLHLIQFASRLGQTKVFLGTQPDEPFPFPRAAALREATRDISNVEIIHHHEQIEQNPEAPGFWKMWKDILTGYGAKKGDLVVSSENYGKQVADLIDGEYFPYDPDRAIFRCKATEVRKDPARYFSSILPAFQPYLRQTVTLFGAESTGKTTLSKSLANTMGGHWIMEWARPYLEVDYPEITTQVMRNIWLGQRALQDHGAEDLIDKPWLFQDTDLFSTVGYWDFWNMQTPQLLVDAALARKSNLYLITQSNIPFEADPIRYGGSKRESDDKFWIDLCEKHGLNYHVIESDGLADRLTECYAVLNAHWKKNVIDRLAYNRLY